jgi:hypothetical protein
VEEREHDLGEDRVDRRAGEQLVERRLCHRLVEGLERGSQVSTRGCRPEERRLDLVVSGSSSLGSRLGGGEALCQVPLHQPYAFQILGRVEPQPSGRARRA